MHVECSIFVDGVVCVSDPLFDADDGLGLPGVEAVEEHLIELEFAGILADALFSGVAEEVVVDGVAVEGAEDADFLASAQLA